MRIALGVQKIGISEIPLAKVIKTYEMIMSKGDGLTIKEIAVAEYKIEEKYKSKGEAK